jgi:hypothetical protein
MSLKYVLMTIFIAIMTNGAVAETILPEQPPASPAPGPGQSVNEGQSNTDGTAQTNKEIVGTNAGGDQQTTTIIDENGNLKIVEPKDHAKQTQPSSSKLPHSDHTNTSTPSTPMPEPGQPSPGMPPVESNNVPVEPSNVSPDVQNKNAAQ